MKFITNYKELEGGNEDKSLLDHCNVDPINNKDNLLSYLSNNEYLEGIRTSHIYDYVSGSRTTITNKTYCDGEYFWTEEEKYHSAIHESGHAIASAVLRPNVENLGISIVPRGNAGGYNLFNDSEERSYLTKEDAISEMVVSYAGKAAEEVILNKVSSGPEADLKGASKIAYSMILKYAMKK